MTAVSVSGAAASPHVAILASATLVERGKVWMTFVVQVMYADLFFLRTLAMELWPFVTLSFLGISLDEQCAPLSCEAQVLYPAWTQ